MVALLLSGRNVVWEVCTHEDILVFDWCGMPQCHPGGALKCSQSSRRIQSLGTLPASCHLMRIHAIRITKVSEGYPMKIQFLAVASGPVLL